MFRRAYIMVVLFGVVSGVVVAEESTVAGRIDYVDVRTTSPLNRMARFWYRVPRDAATLPRGERMRVLVLFGGRNCDGLPEVSGKLGWPDWADAQTVFLIAPTFRDDLYWEPEKWSGAALFKALELLAVRYPICTDRLLFYGYSAGSQASNLFSAWRPDRCRAWVSHACGVFHTPSSRMREVSGLVTCGDADAMRYVVSRAFVDASRAQDIDVLWCSYPNHPHDVPSGSIRLAHAFLAYHHTRHRADLGVGADTSPPETRYVGDDAEHRFYPVTSAVARNILPEDRVPLPCRAVAEAWGDAGEEEESESGESHVTVFSLVGVPFALREPSVHSPTSRVVVLFGGRNWIGERTLSEFGFDELADTNRFFLLAPSFTDRIRFQPYWEPQSGTGRLLLQAVDEVERHFGLAPAPIAIYGYSAGGQCAALFASYLGKRAAAWGSHCCGVFPDPPFTKVPALVTCGAEDVDRWRLSRTFACRYRESGGALLQKIFATGHVLDDDALTVARIWLGDVFGRGLRRSIAWGEDDTERIAPAAHIDLEYRNPLYSAEMSHFWRSHPFLQRIKRCSASE